MEEPDGFFIDFTVIDPASIHLFENCGAVVAIWGGAFTLLDRVRDLSEFETSEMYLKEKANPSTSYPPPRFRKDRKNPERRLAPPVIVITNSFLIGAYGALGKSCLLAAPLNNVTTRAILESPLFGG